MRLSNRTTKKGGKQRTDRTTQLPVALQEQMQAVPAAAASSSSVAAPGSTLTHKQQRELDRRFKMRYDKKQLFGRKQERKQKRLDKKVNRTKLHSARLSHGHKRVDAPSSSQEQTNQTKKDNDDKTAMGHVSQQTRPNKLPTNQQTKQSPQPPQKKKSSLDDPETTRKKLAKIEKSNPALYKMLQSTSVGIEAGIGQRFGAGGGVGAWSADGTTPYDRDDEDIDYYTRKLGVKKSKVFANALKKDGLDELYDSLDYKESSAGGSRGSGAVESDNEVTDAMDDNVTTLKALQARGVANKKKTLKYTAAEQDEEEEEEGEAVSKNDKKGEKKKGKKLEVAGSVKGAGKGKDDSYEGGVAKKNVAKELPKKPTSSKKWALEEAVDDDENAMEIDFEDDAQDLDEGEDLFADLEDDEGDEGGESEDEFGFEAQGLREMAAMDAEMDYSDDDDHDADEMEDDEDEFDAEDGGDDLDLNDDDDSDSDDSDDGLEITFEDDDEQEDEAAPARKTSKSMKPSKDTELDAESEPEAETDVAPAGKYIPPRLRAQATSQSEKYLRLKRQAQGLLNRLSDTNMESIITGLEECYRNNSRHDVTEIITDSVINFISNHANLLDSFVMTYAALISAIFNLVGIEFGAHLTQTTVELYLKSMEEIGTATKPGAPSANEKVTDHPSKRATNLITLLSHLYNFSIVGAPLIYDLVRMCLDRMQELDVEIILKILRVCGSQMRTDDPSALKDIVAIVHERSVKNSDPLFNTPRVKFMIETIMDLKNNKHKSGKKGAASSSSGAATSLQQEKLSKFVTNFLRRRGVPDREALRATLDDIRNVHSKGKWWLVGSAWGGHQADGSTVREKDAAGAGANDMVDSATTDLLKLARAQRMTTDIRRSIFVILMSSEDFVDAYEKLMRLNLKSKQEREIVRVLLHCATNEKTYNPYYYLVATKFCTASHGFKITFQYALWDSIREFENAEDEDNDDNDDGESASNKILRRVSHLAKFYSTLVAGTFLGLTILKSLDFATLSTYPALFCQLFFTHLMSSTAPVSVNPAAAKSPDAHVRNIFERLKAIKESQDLCEGIEFFLEQYVTPRGKDGKPRMGVHVDSLGISAPGGESLVDLLKRRVKIAKEVLLDEVDD